METNTPNTLSPSNTSSEGPEIDESYSQGGYGDIDGGSFSPRGEERPSLATTTTQIELNFMQQSKEMIENLKSKLISEREENQRLKTMIRDQIDIEKVESIMKTMKGECIKYQNQSKAAINERFQMAEKLKKTLNELQTLKDQLRDKESQIEKYKEGLNQISDLKKIHSSVVEESNNLKNKLVEREQQLVIVMGRVKELENIDQEINVMTQTMEKLQFQIADLSKERDTYKLSNRKLEEDVLNKKTQLQVAIERLDELQTEFQRLREAAQLKEQENLELMEENDRTVLEYKEQYGNLQTVIANLESRIDSKDQQVEELKKSNKKLRVEVSSIIRGSEQMKSQRDVVIQDKEDEVDRALYSVSLMQDKMLVIIHKF